ncbi:MAG: dual specificity protein phosphatase family protein [Amylibacter sp.]|nr:dual specificity protein phosphatase family protein [Amylibacter sp.]
MPGDPFQIHDVAGFTKGVLGICKQPCRDADLAAIEAWKPTVVMTLTQEAEFPDMGKPLPVRFLETGYDWLHLPISDFGVPNAKDRALWLETLEGLQAVLGANGKVLVHCKGGKGRSGMVLLKLLVLQGEDGNTALQRIRAIRAGTVETDAQLTWATTPL